MCKNFEAVEVCPHCMGENIYPNWDVEKHGYVAVCQHCGEQIMLCDECAHAPDNEAHHCDWHETETGGTCFRGWTVRLSDDNDDDWDDYCYECTGYGNDYSEDENGELVSNCEDCPFNPANREDW